VTWSNRAGGDDDGGVVVALDPHLQPAVAEVSGAAFGLSSTRFQQ
jgi:hypothetical protein